MHERGGMITDNVFSADVKEEHFSYRTNVVLSVRAALTSYQ